MAAILDFAFDQHVPYLRILKCFFCDPRQYFLPKKVSYVLNKRILYVILTEIAIILYFLFRCFRRTVNKLYPSLTCPERLLGVERIFKSFKCLSSMCARSLILKVDFTVTVLLIDTILTYITFRSFE